MKDADTFIVKTWVETTNLDWLVDVFQDVYDTDWTVEQVDSCLIQLSKMVDIQVYDDHLELFLPSENISEVREMQMAIQSIKKTLGEYANPLSASLQQIERQISTWGGIKRRELSETKLRQVLREAGCEKIIRRMSFYDDYPACWKLFEVY